MNQANQAEVTNQADIIWKSRINYIWSPCFLGQRRSCNPFKCNENNNSKIL